MKSNENGYVLVAVLLFCLILSVIGIAATHTSAIETQIAGNERAFNDNFYNTDGQLIDAIEKRYMEWLGQDDFLGADPDQANKTINIDENDDGEVDYIIEVRCIEPSGNPIGADLTETGDALSDYANDIPHDLHTGPPPPDFFYSAQNFYLRRFAVTVRSVDNRTILQAGVWKAFPKAVE